MSKLFLTSSENTVFEKVIELTIYLVRYSQGLKNKTDTYSHIKIHYISHLEFIISHLEINSLKQIHHLNRTTMTDRN